jgi:hypothetical protein
MMDRRTFGKAIGLSAGTAAAAAVGIANPAQAAGVSDSRLLREV